MYLVFHSNRPLRCALLAICLLTSACATYPYGSASGQRLVGLWKEDGPEIHAITLRSADGTFRKKETQRWNFGRPAVRYTASERWWMRGESYFTKIERRSTNVLRQAPGEVYEHKVLQLTAGEFIYESSEGDGAREEKIRGDTEADFSRTPLEPVRPVPQNSIPYIEPVM